MGRSWASLRRAAVKNSGSKVPGAGSLAMARKNILGVWPLDARPCDTSPCSLASAWS